VGGWCGGSGSTASAAVQQPGDLAGKKTKDIDDDNAGRLA
jgi:hypothetical protein